MTPAHVEGVGELLGGADVPVALMDPDGGAIEDPFGGAVATYARTAEALARHAARWVERLDPTPPDRNEPAATGGRPQESP